MPDVDNHRIGEELGFIDGYYYASVPDDISLPTQHEGTDVTAVTLTDELKENLKKVNPYCKLIDQQIRTKIRERYDAEDEMYLTRISVGTMMGVYTFLPGEQQAVVDYGAYVESIRQWARDERAKIGL